LIESTQKDYHHHLLDRMNNTQTTGSKNVVPALNLVENNVEEDDRQQCWKTGKPMWDEPREDNDSSGDTQDSAERWYEVSTYR
jgi:hypothetical protein